MALVKTYTQTSNGSAFNFNFGFIPSYLEVYNDTKIGSGSGVGNSYWFSSMANASAYIDTLTAGAPVRTKITTNGFTPYQTADSALWTPTNRTITGITQAAQAVVTSTAHGFTSSDIGVTVVTFSGVVGMTQINTLRGLIVAVPNANTFTVNINTTGFSAYSSGGIANIITGVPPETIYPVTGALATPQENAGFIGLTFGSSVCGSNNDVLRIVAFLDAPFTS